MAKLQLQLIILWVLILSVFPQKIDKHMLLPVETTQGAITSYSIGFSSDTSIQHSAKVRITFPYEFDPRKLIFFSKCELQKGQGQLKQASCKIDPDNPRRFLIDAGRIVKDQRIIVVISNIRNPKDDQISTQFVVETMFLSVVVTANKEFGRTPFTSDPVDGGSSLLVYNYRNTLIEQGSSWVFKFTLSKTYPADTTIRFVFPEGFSSHKVQCNVSGVIDPSLRTRTFAKMNVYDCLNINSELSGDQKVILSGIINPDYEMSIDGQIEVHILQPNSRVILEKIVQSPTTPISIDHKAMNTTIKIPNKFRNNTITYIFQINIDSNLRSGDKLQLQIEGNWTFFPQDCKIIEGINKNGYHTPYFENTEFFDEAGKSVLEIKNFSSIRKSSQIAFYVSMRTPLDANNYGLTLSAFRDHGGLVEKYEEELEINATTGYIKEMRLHPMIQAVKLPVGDTGPLEITLGLRNNLPKTNVLTYGMFIIEIIPKIPKPDINRNGVPKCYFYGDILAKNCTYDDTSDPTKTIIQVFTPIDFNFQSSQIPFMVTTEGFIDEEFQGITIDTLVKRYHFHIQFYTDYREAPIPTEVIFGDWVPDSIAMSSFSCNTMVRGMNQWDHLECTFTTPSEDLCQPGFIHFFRIQFTGSNPSYYGWHRQLGYSSNQIYPDYPCIGYGDNLKADPYIKCDLVTWTSGPYVSAISKPYINIYGFEFLKNGSTITVEIPSIKRYHWTYQNQLRFSILEDTYGYQTDYITLYSQVINQDSTSYESSSNNDYDWENVTNTLSNPIINKQTNITLDDYDLGSSGVTHVVFEVDQAVFEDIGRGHHIQCGNHLCSKFNKPVQYFILHPQTTLNQVENLTFPFIITPPYSGTFEFKLRLYKNNAYVRHSYFDVVVDPEEMNAPTYDFHSVLEPTRTLYVNTKHYFTIDWTTVNDLPSTTSFMKITLDNYFTLVSDYCVLNTTAPAADGRAIECEIWETENIILIQHMGAVPGGSNFKLDLQLITTNTGTISPTVSIKTYYDTNKLVDYITNAPFVGTSISVVNKNMFTKFEVANPQIVERKPTKGYFGHLLFTFRPRLSESTSQGTFLRFTFTNDFYPYSNTTGLPLICQINDVRYPCTYTLNPLVITISDTENGFTASDNSINITTEYLDHNGFHYPENQGKYLLQVEVANHNYTIIYETVQQYVDILPGTVDYFNVSYAHRDIGKDNIFTVEFRNGPTAIPAYNSGSTAGRIYIGFPTRDDNGGSVFETNLGFDSGLGTVVPCFFEGGPTYITPVSGQDLKCMLRTSPYAPNFAYIEIINFDTVAASTNVKIIMAKIKNPTSKKYDVNFILKVNTITVSNKEQFTLYESYYNMFFNMLSPSTASRSQTNSNTTMFQPGTKVGDTGKYIKNIPYTASGGFSEGDWYIVDMNDEFELSGSIGGCLPTFYEYCIVFKEINWMAVKIGNTTLIDLQLYVTKMPTSISRVDTTYQAFTFKSERWSETITYTITAAHRWMELRGAISGFSFEILGSHDKLNIGEKDVEVMVVFNVTHIVNRGGTIEIQFPNNSTYVPSIKPHCRSGVTMGSQLYGDPTGKPSTNKQGEVGCLVQNSYSWLLTSFDELPAGSQVKVIGVIDFPTASTASLGMGWVVTYSDTHSSNVFTHGRIIDYLTTNFPLEVNNKTWSLDPEPTMYISEPLRAGHKGELKFKLSFGSTLYNYNSGGYIDISLWRYNVMGMSGGFSGPTSNMVCTIKRLSNNERFGCYVSSSSYTSTYYYYRLQTIEHLSPNVEYEIVLTTQNGNANEGINFPTSHGKHKIEVQMKYSSGNSQHVGKAHYVEVYGSAFPVAKFYSTVDIPGADNMILLEFTPYNTITRTTEQFVIEIPTMSIDGQSLFPEDLGLGYEDYDDLKFDLYESSISSMECKVYTGYAVNHQPVKIVCGNFNIDITSSHLIKMGFWVKNPTTNYGMAIPVQIYSYDPYRDRKDTWSIIEAAIKVLPTSQTPISDDGNFALSSTFRQINSQHFDFTTRNTRSLLQGDFYILKFNFDLRREQKEAGKFKYNSGLSHSGDVIFMRNCQTVILRVGGTALGTVSSGSTAINARMQSVFYNPAIQLTTVEKKIQAYAIYLSSDDSEYIPYSDAFPDLVPRQLSNPSFTFSAIHSNQYKGQREDYKIAFTFTTSSSATDMAAVKKISIHFPPFSTYDMKFFGTECIEHSSSQIQVDDCLIDPTTYTMWITPKEKTTYQNNHNLQIQTAGLAIINPVNSGSINKNQFVFKYYTWDGPEPALFSNSDDYVFFKQDSSYISSSTLSYSNTYKDPHSDLQFPRELYVNEFQPASTDLGNNRMKTPLEFKFKAMTTFSDLSSGGNYHHIRVQFNTYYTHVSINQASQDLYKYVPTCHLNGQRIEDCYISSGKIGMRFQQYLASGSEVAVRFSVLNPTNEADDGFYITNLNNPTVTLPIEFFPYGGGNHYGEAEPFHTFYRVQSGGVYPELGIYSASVTYGTQVYGKINYLEFSLSFSRNDINGLILEIPVVSPDGSKIYNDPTLLGLPSGSQYPCSVGIDTNVYCYYEKGSSSDYGRPTRIYINQFSIQSGNTLSLRMLFTNPDIVEVFPSFTFKAFGGSYSAPKLMGDQLMGRYTIIDPFKTYPDTGYTSTGSCQVNPDRGLWNRQTYMYFYINHAQNANSYVVLEWVLNHNTYGQVSEYDLTTSDIVDYFTISYSPSDRRLYLVKKLGGYYSGGSNYHRFGRLRSKHFHHNAHKVYLLKKPGYSLITCAVSESYMDSHREYNEYGNVYIEKFDIEDRAVSQTSWYYLSLYMGNAQNMLLRDEDPGDFIVAVKFTSNIPYASMGSSTKCIIEQGVTSTYRLKPVTCEIQSSTNSIIFRNVNKFSGNLLRFYFEATTPTHSPHNVAVQIRAYANSQSYASSDGWALFRGTTGGYTMVQIYYTSGSYASTAAPNTGGSKSVLFNGWVDLSGYSKIVSYSSNSIKIQIKRGSNADFSNVYYMSFRFYTERLQPNGCTGVSFYSSRYGSNFKSLTSCGSESRHFWAHYDFYSTGGNSWPYWYAGDYYDFTFTFNSVTADVNSPAIYMFSSMSISWYQSIYHHGDQGKCGCCGDCCGDSSCCCNTCCNSCYWLWCCSSHCCCHYCCWYYCCSPCSCRWYYSWGTFVLTGRTSPKFSDQKTLVSSASIDLVSRQRSVETELMLQANNFHINVGPSYNNWLLFHFDNGQSHPNNNPFPATDHTEVGAYIDCKCLVHSSLSENYATSYQEPQCVRYNQNGLQPSIGIFIDIPSSRSLRCYFPGYLTSTATSKLSTDIMVMDDLILREHTKRGDYWSPYISYNMEQSDYQTAGTSGSLSIYENNFWTSAESYQSRYYEANMTGYNTAVPTIYMSMYMPKPVTSFCAYSSFYFCRVYTSFVNRRYYVVAQWTGTTSTIRFNGTAYFPPSDDYSSSYYKTYIGWTETGSERYYHIWQSTRSTSMLSPNTPSYSYTPVLYGSNLRYYPSTFHISINLSGRTLYSNKRNYGQYEGSKIRVELSGFTSLFGCGVTLSNRPLSFSHPFYCSVVSSNTLDIYVRQDLSMSGTLYVTFHTSSVPTSTTYRVHVYDKYFSGSDYSRSVYRTASFSRTTSYSVVQPTAIQWRKQVFKEFRTSNGPIRFTFNHNYQYVYDYQSTSSSDAIVVYYPGGISSSYTYACFLKEFEHGKKHLYREYEAKCSYYTSNTIRIQSIPSHIISPNYYYEITIFRNNNNAQAYLTANTGDYFQALVRTVPTLASYTIVNEDYILIERYRSVYPIVLNHIYILTREAAATNSLYVSFTVNTGGSSYQYFEFEFDNLGLSSFQIENGEQIPCYLSGDFNTISGKVQQPICRGYTEGIDEDSPLKIRVLKFASFSSGTAFQLAFDNFNNPSLQPLFLVPINMRITYVNRNANDIFTSNFPSIYISDSHNVGIPTPVSGSLSRANSNRGTTSTYQYVNLYWPYSSNYNDISEKMVMKIEGGIACCNNYDNFVLDDNQISSYTELWTDKVANMTVYRTPTHSNNLYTQIQIKNVNNPHPYQKEDYEQIKKIQILFYDGYKNRYIKQLDQYSFSSYNRLSEILVDTNLGSPVDPTRSYNYHQNYPMTYDIQYNLYVNSFNNRKIDQTILKFTGGVKSIEDVYVRYTQSPYVVNTLLQVNIFRDSSNYWCLRISGMDDNNYSTSQRWILRMRFYPNANTLSYTSTTYNENGEIEATNSDSESLSGDGYSSSAIAPSTFELYEQRYTKYYYELQRSWMYADSSLETRRLAFRFTAPYEISENEVFDIKIPVVNTFVGQTSPNNLLCILQQVDSHKTILGAGLYSTCNYSLGVYSVKVPLGGLELKEYTLSIMEIDQTTTKFTMPSSPDRYEVSFIYTSGLGLQFGDTYLFTFSALLKSFSVNHLTLRYSTYNMIGFTFTPKFTLGAASLTSPVTQSVLEIELQSRYFADCLGVDSIYSNDGMQFESGVYFSHYSSPVVNNANTRLHCGQYSESYTPIKLTVTDYGQMTANSNYYFRFPLITNPSFTNAPLTYRVRLLHYGNSEHYPVVMNEYRYHGFQRTVSGSSSWQYIYTSESSDDVQKTMSLSTTYNYYYPPNGAQVLVKFKNNELEALTSISTLTTLSNSNYNYEYYPNINLCVFKKSNSNSDKSISLGSYPTSEDQRSYTISWVYAYPSTSQIYTSNFNPGTSQTKTIDYATSWSSSSFTKVSGWTHTNAMGVYRISWSSSSLTFSEGSYMKVTIDTEFAILEDHCKEIGGFLPGTTLETSNLICRKDANSEILIAGYNSISAGTSLSITLYLQVAYNSLSTRYPNARIIVYSQDDNKIIDAQTSSYTLVISDYGSYTFALEDHMEKYIQKGNSQELDLVFKLQSHTLYSGYYLLLNLGNWTVDTAANEGKVIWKYQVGNNIYWVPTEVTDQSNNQFKIPVNSNYSMTAGQDIKIRIYHLLPDSDDGVFFTEHQWNELSIEAYNSANTLLEHQYARLWIEPYQHTSLMVTPILKYAGAVTMYEFTFTPNVSAAAGDYISVEFATNDNLETTLFSNDLGRSIDENSSLELSCRESDYQNVISDDPIKCELFKGNKDATPSIPTTILIPITKSISANTQIKFNVLNLQNPSKTYYPIGISVTIKNLCENEDMNNPCTFYRSTKYIEFNNAPSIPGVGTTGSQSFNPNHVSATNAEHTFSAGYSIDVGDYIKIVTIPQIALPDDCQVTSGNAICYMYPLESTILIKFNTSYSSTYTVTLGGMTNLYQSRVTDKPYTEVWDASSGTIRSRFYTNYWVNHITSDPETGNNLGITFTPTLTPDYQLKYSFNNIARIEISHLMQNKDIEMIYVWANWEITFVTSYCNATLESTTEEATPYPYRFECYSIGTRSLYLRKQANFPEWDSNHTNKKIVIYLKYTISNSKSGNSNYWYARAYTTTSTTSTDYRVAEAYGLFPIIEYQSPYIYKIDFWTQSVKERTCQTNDLCMFYGYLQPSTPQSSIAITKMLFTLAPEFGYSKLQSYDSCVMEEKNDDYNPITCAASRSNSELNIWFTPSSYNHNYKLIKIDTSNQAQLFKSPRYPGDHYQMKVGLYANSGALVEQMMVNLTTVYGELLEYPQIYINIPMDANSIGLFEFKFRVGSTDVLPSFENTASNRITSAIEVQFSKSFESDLGTGKQAGDEIACVPVSGMTFSTTGKLTCKIYPSVSTITYPRIIATGFDRIYSGTDVVFRVAGLKTLDADVEDYIKIGVSLTYFDYGRVKGYVYELTGIVVGNTTAAITPISITSAEVNESSTNFVGDLVNYTFSGTLSAGFADITPTDFIGIEFQQSTFEGFFSLNSQALCSLAASSTCYSFGISNIIYFQPSSTISSSALNFNINNVINSAYSFEYVNIDFRIFTLVDGKVDAEGVAVLNKFSKPSKNVSALITKVDSRYGGDSGINYYIDLSLNANLPRKGLISIRFPNVYKSLFELNSECILKGKWSRGAVECKIINSYLIVIAANGELLNPELTYSLVITNITNPNMKLDNYSFTIATFHTDNIYDKLMISRNTFNPPEISVLTVKTCDTFEVQLTAMNAFYESTYKVSLICPNYIKQASELKLYLSWKPSPTTKDQCQSDSESLYSYQCRILNEFQGTENLTYLSVYLRQISPQKLISLSGSITNGQLGIYTIVANISYKGFTYLSTTSNEFQITSDEVTPLRSRQIKIKNYPFNRNYDAIYTVKMPNPKNAANELMIELPTTISEASSDMVCSYLPQKFNENFFNLIQVKNDNNIACRLSGSTVVIDKIDTIQNLLGNDDFLRLAIYRLKNANISTWSHSYKVTFLDTSTGEGSVISSGVVKTPYRISPTPTNIQFNNIIVGSTKLFVKTNYTFEISTVNNEDIHINSDSRIGVLIVFPDEYKAIWQTIESTKNRLRVYVTFGNDTYSDRPELINGSMIVKFRVTEEVFFSSITIKFEFRNPKVSLNCDVLPVFTISILDFKLNAIRAESLSNNIECPDFKDSLFGINVTGNIKIRAGDIETFTISLAKPAKFLNITPVSSTPAITFDPESIIFENYAQKEKTFEVKVSTAVTGTFSLTYTKQEGNKIFYNDIPEENITIVEPIRKYRIVVRKKIRKSVGLPIPIRIDIPKPSSKELSLLYTHNCSSQYVFDPPSYKLIQAGIKRTNISITYKGDTIPEMCKIKFEISSLTKHNYELKNAEMYITGSRSIDKGSTIAPMMLEISPEPKESSDVGYSILNKATRKIKPRVYKIEAQNMGANAGDFLVSGSEQGVIYCAVMEIGTTRKKVQQEDIYNRNLSTGLKYGNTSTDVTNTLATIQASIKFTGLESQTSYLLGCYLNTSVGISNVRFQRIKTVKSSNGAGIMIALSAIEEESVVIEKFSEVLRIEPDRMKVITIKQKLTTHKDTFVGNVMNTRQYIYDIVIGPNPLDDTVSPKSVIDEFVGDDDQIDDLEESLPDFDRSYTMPTREIILAKPKFRNINPVKVEELTHESAKINVSMWEQAIVYAVIVQRPTQNLLSAQIAGGYNADNEKVDPEHFASGTTNEKGMIEMEFTLLKDETQYAIFVTAECVLPYKPRVRLGDNQIKMRQVDTHKNLNLWDSQDYIALYIEKLNKQLAEFIRYHQSNNQAKKKMNKQSQRRKRRRRKTAN